MSADDNWEEIWNARADALSRVFGPMHDRIYHAVVPFFLGGQADVVAFHHHLSGVVFVTAELTGEPDASQATYELMICNRSPSDWHPNVISRLAQYTLETHIGASETMDIDSASPSNSQIKAFIFDTYRTFTLFGSECELRLVGITKAELDYKMEHGSDELLSRLKAHGIYPYTDLERQSIPLDS